MHEPVTDIDPKDAATPDAWIPRHPDLIRLTGRCSSTHLAPHSAPSESHAYLLRQWQYVMVSCLWLLASAADACSASPSTDGLQRAPERCLVGNPKP